MPRLTLLGTVHRDPQGVIRLVQALTVLRPDVITLEFSTYGARYRLQKGKSFNHSLLRGLIGTIGIDGLHLGALKKLMRTTGVGGIRALLDLPFEYKGASFYSHRNGIPLYCVDISSLSRQLLGKIDEIISSKNLKRVIAFETSPLQETVAREYKQAETILFKDSKPAWRLLIPADKVWSKRERILANRIRKISARYTARHIVHVGGWQHLAARQGTVFSLLEDLMPQRVLLSSLWRQPS